MKILNFNRKMTREEENNLQKAKEDYRIPYTDFVGVKIFFKKINKQI